MSAGTARPAIGQQTDEAGEAIGQQTDEAGEALWQEAAHKGKGLQVPRRFPLLEQQGEVQARVEGCLPSLKPPSSA